MFTGILKNFSVFVGITFLVILFGFSYSAKQYENIKRDIVTNKGASAYESDTGFVSVPAVGEKNVDKNIAVPILVVPAAPKSDRMMRTFSLTAQGGQFTPGTIIARVGDTVHLDIRAVDGGYDFLQPELGLSTFIKKGEARAVEFSSLTTGKFSFYCEQCGRAGQSMDSSDKGYIIIVK
jgi:heme/copper-type cytochrome/quinol oxidase subunit 2